MSILSWDDLDEQTPAGSVTGTENTQSNPTVGSGGTVDKAPSLLDQLMSADSEDTIVNGEANANTAPGGNDIGSRPDVMAEEARSVADTKMDQIMLDPIAEMRKRCTNPEELAALDYLASMDLMHGAIDTEGAPIQASDKRVIRGASDVNQLIPFKYEWAWQKYLDASANHWMPQEIAMSRDIAMWKAEVGSKDGLTEDERMIIMRALGFFSTADSVVMNNLVKAIYDWITSPEHRQYIGTQIKEESIHQHAYQYCIESLGMDQAFVFNMYRKVPSMTLKSAWCIKHTLSSDRRDYDSEDAYDKAMIKNMVSQYIVMEGIFFYCGFASVLSMGRRNKMPGVCEQFQYILRDECVTGDTELLTPTGWKNVKDITYNDDIAQWSTNGAIEFVQPQKLSKTLVDHVYEFKSSQGHFNQCVSENHRMVYFTKHKQLKVVEAKDAAPNPYAKFINVGLATGDNPEITLWERFLIAVQADGSIDTRADIPGKFSGTQMVQFAFAKQRKIDRMTMLLEDLGFEYKLSYDKKERAIFHVFVPHEYHLYKHFNWVDLTDQSYWWCQDFIWELAQWDGHIVQDKPLRITYVNTCREDVDMVQAICALAGYRTCLTVRPDHRSETFSDCYVLNITTHIDTTSGGAVTKERIEGEQMVYGIQVPSTFILIRRHGAVSVTGNSMHLNFGVDTINQIRIENPELFDAQLMADIKQMIISGTLLEIAFAYDTAPRGILGYNASSMEDYLKFIADRRLEQLGIAPFFNVKHNPFQWMSEMMDLRKEKNFND